MVQAVHLPPRTGPVQQTVYNGANLSILPLLQSIIGDNSSVIGSSIITLPAFGTLYADVNGTQTPVEDIDLGRFNRLVMYNYVNNIHSESWSIDEKSEFLAFDNFTFRLYDKRMNYSAVVTYHLQIARAISLSLSSILTVTQNEYTTFIVQAHDLSRTKRNLCLRTFPGVLGMLYDPFDNITMDGSDTSILNQNLNDTQYDQGFLIAYQSKIEHFSIPSVTFPGGVRVKNLQNDSITLQAFDCDDDNVRSAMTTSVVMVQNVNRPTEIEYHGLDDESILTVFRRNVQDDVANSHELSVLRIQKVLVVDKDQDINLIRVDIKTSQGGIISLSSTLNVDFTSSEYCFSSEHWYCYGNGNDDSFMTFVATPTTVQSVLNNMTY